MLFLIKKKVAYATLLLSLAATAIRPPNKAINPNVPIAGTFLELETLAVVKSTS